MIGAFEGASGGIVLGIACEAMCVAVLVPTRASRIAGAAPTGGGLLWQHWRHGN